MTLTPGKILPAILLAAGAVLTLSTAGAGDKPAHDPMSNVKNLHATDFSQEQYYEAPNDQHIKLRLAGAEALPLPGGLLDIKQLKIESFSPTGTPEAVLLAPQCTYAPLEGRASSAGHLEISSFDGQFRLEGEGFLFQQAQQTNLSLSISNRVRTVIQLPAGKRNLL